MKLSKLAVTLMIAAPMALSMNPALAKRGGNGGGGTTESPPDPVFWAESSDPGINTGLDSHGNTGDQIVWYYDSIDLSSFTGTWSTSGGACSPGVVSKPTLVIERKSQSDPVGAHVLIWYQSQLESGDSVTHLMTMEGTFDEPDNWPPSVDSPTTSVTLNYWEFAAENKKAQRVDCAGDSGIPGTAGTWTIDVSRVSNY